jgi:hypothetical protein
MTFGTEGLSRRVFLRGGAAMAFLAAVPAARARASATGAAAKLKRYRFTPLVGARLRMTGGGDDAHVVLAQVGDLFPVLRPDDQNRFSLMFTIPRGRHRPSPGIRTFHHPLIGHVQLFVSPVGRGRKALHYEAVINRSRS